MDKEDKSISYFMLVFGLIQLFTLLINGALITILIIIYMSLDNSIERAYESSENTTWWVQRNHTKLYPEGDPSARDITIEQTQEVYNVAPK